MPVQKCPMCGETKRVLCSHLYPAAIYKYFRGAEGTSPVRVGDGVIMHTDRQVQADLLCPECEDLLSKGGETWVSPRLARTDKTFPLYDILTAGQPASHDQHGGVYFAARNRNFEVEKLTHFSMGIFWKASVHSWRSKEKSPLINLSSYADTIRTWLRGTTEFPKNVCLAVIVAKPHDAIIAFNGPVESKSKPWKTFLLTIPGVTFILNVGKLLDQDTRYTCIYTNAEHPVLVSDQVTGKVREQLQMQYLESRKTKSYIAAKVKRSTKQQS
jgi:hypothetical protein